MKKLLIISLGLSLLYLYSCKSSSKLATPPAEKITKDYVGFIYFDSTTVGKGNPYQAHLAYRDEYETAAVAEMMRSGVPASITLAQGILESNAGQSELAREANNHFGIKCGSSWKGKSFKKLDDDRDSRGKRVESCFRKYETIEACFFDHSEFLRDPRKYNRYGFLFNLPRTDYRAWARGLQTAGYATSRDYADKLINIIERYELYKYDRPGTGADDSGNRDRRVGKVNDTRVVLARDGETLTDIARLYDMSSDKLVRYNDQGFAKSDKLKGNTRIYTEQKKSSWRGSATHHFVRKNETMFDISQLYGIQLDKLLVRNGMQRGQEPMKGEKIRLKGAKSKSEYIRLRSTDEQPEDHVDPEPIINKPAFPPSMVPDEEVIIQPNDPTPVTPPVQTEPTTPAPPASAQYHTVQRGDTLFGLARRYGTTVSNIKSLNNMTDNQINVGQRLRVK
jgi:LysM repeat protein